jgi:hypothetical protein
MDHQVKSNQISRPLNVLVPVIKREIDLGDKAGEEASRPYHRKAGSLLIEAALTDDGQSADEFWEWAEETFDRPKKFLRDCMEKAFENNEIKNLTAPYETLGDLLRSKNRLTHGFPKGQRGGKDVHDAIKEPIRQAVSDKKLGSPKMKLIDERALQKKLALELIDIGYKALATKLHPDKKGGSREAMRRLNDVRALLKKLVARR